MLEVQSITRHYGELKAVDEVSFSINRGEIVGLLGHNGAGKTTIMKMLSGFLEPDTGSIKFHGISVSDSPEALQQQLGYLPENLPVYPELSIASYLDYAAELKGLTGKDKRQAIKSVIETTDLGSRLLSPISTLSRGMKQRVGVAQAIIGKPSLLILDEPTNGLDPTQTEHMRQVIRNISESATVILSTHIMQEVEALCDRALIIRQGRLAVDAGLHDLTRSNRIALCTSADAEAIQQVMKQAGWFKGINPGNHIGTQQDVSQGLHDYILQVDDPARLTDCLAECAQLLVNANIPVMGLRADTQNLQSLFVQVNSDQPLKYDSANRAEEVKHVA
ncbi:MAG: ABC transporter ATP-binding protein [Granulosicoccus sp.]|nr:ABC transporter ATP-binding protein [Granulosicoccus sp.]